MRAIDLAVGLMLALAATVAAAFEIEEEATFPGSGASVVRVISTTDTQAFAPVIAAFQERRPEVTVIYTVASSGDVFEAVRSGGAFDLVISSAMDLQLKLVNDGFARSHAAQVDLPGWARWRDQLYAIAQEPVVMIASRAAFAGLEVPRTRAALVAVLRDNPERFRGRIGTYDPGRSGAAYLFATQDTRASETSWRLAEVMGRLEPRLFATSGDMIAGVQAGELALAYNVLGSYAEARLAGDPDALVIEPEDFTHVLLRTALIPAKAEAAEEGAAFLDFLLSDDGQALIESESGLPRINEAALAAGPHRRPIRLDPGLLVFVDPLMRQQFLEEWRAAVVQP